MPFERSLRVAIEVVESATVPEAALDAEIRAVVVDGECVGSIGLDLDGVGAGCGRSVEELQSPIQAAVVVSGQLADDIRLEIWPDATAGDRDERAHCFSP